MAQDAANQLLARFPGHATAAAYVETTLAHYRQANSNEQGVVALGKTSDSIYVVKLVGSFNPAAMFDSPTDPIHSNAIALIQVYDLTIRHTIESTVIRAGTGTAPKTVDISGDPYDLSKLGQPIPLTTQ